MLSDKVMIAAFKAVNRNHGSPPLNGKYTANLTNLAERASSNLVNSGIETKFYAFLEGLDEFNVLDP